ncbi:centrosomal protein CCDC61 [Strix uralensis]|uniref:centrosomal protein CCDC61 n=1 Tax=Strix uralensis TaxID=36305 RepID=UPI003DA3699D
MEEPRYLQADCSFRLGAHTVRLTLARSALGVEVEAARTAERWRGDFDAAFIEDLTHKTGNFKQFGIFCSMLESALRRSSASVSLDLLTYADLQTLRTRKTGASARPPPSTPSPLGAKRYLLLVYSVEFDRIHYPLPLPYAGGPDPAALLRELREELAQLRARRDAEIQHLQDKLQRVQEGKRAAEAALRRAEDELLREKTQRQRDHQQLSTELAEMKAAEQRLQRRVKSLTAELAACRRGPPQERRSGSAPRSASRESRGGSQGRPPPRSPSPAGPRPPRFDPTAFVRARQRRQELKNQRRGAAFGSTSPARSRGRSSSAESFRSWRSAVSSSSDADERPKTLPPRGRRATRTRTPLSASSCNGPGAAPRPAAGRKPPVRSVATGKENCYEEPSAELAEIDARLQALQEYMDRLDTRT